MKLAHSNYPINVSCKYPINVNKLLLRLLLSKPCNLQTVYSDYVKSTSGTQRHFSYPSSHLPLLHYYDGQICPVSQFFYRLSSSQSNQPTFRIKGINFIFILPQEPRLQQEGVGRPLFGKACWAQSKQMLPRAGTCQGEKSWDRCLLAILVQGEGKVYLFLKQNKNINSENKKEHNLLV